MYNVNAVRLWTLALNDDSSLKENVQWWPGPKRNPPRLRVRRHAAGVAAEDAPTKQRVDIQLANLSPESRSPSLSVCSRNTPAPETDTAIFRVGRFIGQGRVTLYAGLSYAVMAETNIIDDSAAFITDAYTRRPQFSADQDDGFVDRVYERLRGPRPPSWFITAVVSEVIVVGEIMLALMLAFNTPTVGLGCWSGSFAIYAILSSLSWVLALVFARPGYIVRCISLGFNLLSLACIVTVVILVVSETPRIEEESIC
jgi:hypothetical protein